MGKARRYMTDLFRQTQRFRALGGDRGVTPFAAWCAAYARLRARLAVLKPAGAVLLLAPSDPIGAQVLW